MATSRSSLTCTHTLRGADLAEGYAVSAVDVALAATDEAEYAVLDAILAWPTPTQPTADGPGRA